ncbi:hypothetical protein A9X81_12355 [Brachyspira hyodysenteriae]|uniref:hypothetical protein n=1 Tax=Brachyspira hyodysenteriae TaxID=159 RepID=UPI00063DD77C|nr:hypothetical protein [Brachyspira hyodysenteriae]KLI51258.1 hypothetical protein SZ43_12205 [Brachyspira hyodysenteriae]MCZ9886876.1 hypothetical protein [Brachyspira hyodysenteriae]MDA0023918.1 hypothetical protein [Brachyspira hyodysenteriae]TVL79710.1 hypothetical protein A9X81_12355 [Brachyspira hyodysenteriae]TVL82730.1 hypothetical protein A9X80_11310 [Brachyspira hyodysenteriae]
MSQKLFNILFTIFLVGILVVSCSNKDKTGVDGNSAAKYAGDWYEKGDQGYIDMIMTISADGNISFPTIEKQGPTDKKVEGSESSYTVTYTFQTHTNAVVKITFTDADNGQVTIIAEGAPDSKTIDIVKRK